MYKQHSNDKSLNILSMKQPCSVQGQHSPGKHDRGAVLPCSFPTPSKTQLLCWVSLSIKPWTWNQAAIPLFLPADSAISLSRKLSECGSAPVHAGTISSSRSQS